MENSLCREECATSLRAACGIHERFGIGEELFAGSRQADVITMTGEQIHTKLIFQLTNTKADC